MRPKVKPWLPIGPQYRGALLRRRWASRVEAKAQQNGVPAVGHGAEVPEAVFISKTAEEADISGMALLKQQQAQRRAQTLASISAPPMKRPKEASAVAGAPSRAVAAGKDLAASAAAAAKARAKSADLRTFTIGAAAAVAIHYLINFIGTLPLVRYFLRRFIWQGRGEPSLDAEEVEKAREKALGDNAEEETVEWVNMCWRKAWRVYQRGLERWLAGLLQPVFDNLVADGMVPRFVQRLRIAEFTLDHEAPYFSNMRRRNSRKDSDLTGVVDVRYTGGARMLLLIECGTGRWRVKVPVMVSDLDLECAMWLKIRLAPMCPYIGTVSLAFVGPPTIKVQLSPYNRVRLMRIPILQPFLSKLLTKDLPALMTLPQRLSINIPPAVTAVAEAAVGRDAVMRAVASAVLQADALEHALISALPLGPQGAAGGISLPDLFQGELQVVLKEARDLPVWGFPWQSNPYCRLVLGSQAVRSRRDSETSQTSKHRAPVWNQEFQFLVEDPTVQDLEVLLRDSPITGRTEVGRARFKLSDLQADGTLDVWLPVESSMPGERTQGAIHLSLMYRPFLDDDQDSGYREAAAFAESLGSQDDLDAGEITDVKSAADASSRAAVAASAAAAAVAVTKAAAARAAARLARAARGEGDDNSGGNGSNGTGDSGNGIEASAESSSSSNGGSSMAETVSHTGVTTSENGATTRGADAHSNGNGASASSAAEVLSAHALPPLDLDVLSKLPSATDPAAQEAAVAQLEAMAATMQQLTEDVQQLNSAAIGTEAAAAEAAAKAVAAAEALAVTAVVAGDVGAANRALQEAAAALEKTAVKMASGSMSGDEDEESTASTATLMTPRTKRIPKLSVSSEGQTPEERAAAALAAAQAAAAAAAAAVAAAEANLLEKDGNVALSSGSDGSSADEEDVEASLAADAIPGTARSIADGDDSPSGSDNESAPSSAWPQSAPWWNQAIQMVPGVPARHDFAADAAAEGDGSVGAMANDGNAKSPSSSSSTTEQQAGWWGGDYPESSKEEGSEKKSGAEIVVTKEQIEAAAMTQNGAIGDIIISPDIPIEEIAAEVQKSWKLRDRHVETLLQKAVESRVRRSERPWLIVTAVMATTSAVLLSIVLYRLYTGQ